MILLISISNIILKIISVSNYVTFNVMRPKMIFQIAVFYKMNINSSFRMISKILKINFVENSETIFMNMLYMSKVVKGFKSLSLKWQNKKNKFFSYRFLYNLWVKCFCNKCLRIFFLKYETKVWLWLNKGLFYNSFECKKPCKWRGKIFKQYFQLCMKFKLKTCSKISTCKFCMVSFWTGRDRQINQFKHFNIKILQKIKAINFIFRIWSCFTYI